MWMQAARWQTQTPDGPASWQCVCWSDFFHDRKAQDENLFLLLKRLRKKRKEIGRRALYHHLASSVELKTIPNPDIVHTQCILSTTGSWQSGKKKKLQTNKKTPNLTVPSVLFTKQYFFFLYRFSSFSLSSSTSFSSSSSVPPPPLW